MKEAIAALKDAINIPCAWEGEGFVPCRDREDYPACTNCAPCDVLMETIDAVSALTSVGRVRQDIVCHP